MKTPIVQFGTSRFLQAHADLFISDAMAAGQNVGPITVVQTSGDPARAGRLKGFHGKPVPIVIRGLEAGRPVERTEFVTSIAHGLSAASEWAIVRRVFVDEAEVVITNVGDGGYGPENGETLPDSNGVPVGFPGKLTALLYARWRESGKGLTIFPCELIPKNGAALRGRVLATALRSLGQPSDFLLWLHHEVIFANSLVDRIVSGALEPAGAIAEPYALWAIEKQPRLEPPCVHPAIRVVDDLRTLERLKLFILNLGHSVFAERWLAERRPANETVRAMMNDAAARAELDAVYAAEVLPVFAAAGIDEAPAYRATVIERFSNPFLDHRLSDIADNHATKKARRMGGILAWAAEVAPGLKQPRLAAIAGSGIGGAPA